MYKISHTGRFITPHHPSPPVAFFCFYFFVAIHTHTHQLLSDLRNSTFCAMPSMSHSSHVSLTPAQQTLMSGNCPTSSINDTQVRFILHHGWAAATTRQYASAVNRYLTFMGKQYPQNSILPATSKNIYHFILWCAKTATSTVSSNTIKRYLTGLRMWHVLHDHTFPTVNSHRIWLLLKSCSKTEVKKIMQPRSGLLLRDLVDLTDRLTTSSRVDLVMKAIILVGFWGLARLGEITRHRDHPETFLQRRDVSFSKDGRSARLHIRMAKTASPGETQVIRLRAQPNKLDPINVIHEVLTTIPGSDDDPLFPGVSLAVPMNRSRVVSFLKANGPLDGSKWGGHSLRIGGASFQHEAGRALPSLKRLGRWKSSSYKLYVRKYSCKQQAETTALASCLHF